MALQLYHAFGRFEGDGDIGVACGHGDVADGNVRGRVNGHVDVLALGLRRWDHRRR